MFSLHMHIHFMHVHASFISTCGRHIDFPIVLHDCPKLELVQYLFHNAVMQRSKLQQRQKDLEQQLLKDINAGDIGAARNTVQLQVILSA